MDEKGLLNMIADELYRVTQEGPPRSGVGKDALNSLNEIAHQLSKAAPLTPVSNAVQNIPTTLHSIPLFMINGGNMLRFGRSNAVNG